MIFNKKLIVAVLAIIYCQFCLKPSPNVNACLHGKYFEQREKT